jgi:hypothetical protein
MQFSVIEVDKFDESKNTYDTGEIYLCPARYYQYNIAKGEWVEVKEITEPKIENLSYWTDPDGRDKNKIYLCGTTYYQFVDNEWKSSAKFNMQIVQIDGSDSSKMTDQSKVYKCCPLYYIYEENDWKEYNKASDVAGHNNGFGPVDNDRKSFIVMLNEVETSMFEEKYKGRVQAEVFSGTNKLKSKIEYFTVYPAFTDEIFGETIVSAYVILDGGEVI